MLRKQQRSAGVQSHLDLASLGTQLQLYPALTEFMFRTTWEEDGEARVPGTVMLFGDGTFLKGMLNDKGQQLVAFVTLEASEDILGELDRHVVATSTDWRRAKVFASKR